LFKLEFYFIINLNRGVSYMENKKDYKILIIIGIILSISLIIGMSYAYWMITHTQANKNVAATGCFTTTFTEANDINLNNQFPISDADGKKLTPYTFTITNTCTIAANYQVNMEVLNTTTADLAYIKTELNDDTPVILNTYATVDKTIDTATSSYKMTTGYLGASQSVTYNLRIWIDQDAPLATMQNKLFESKIVVVTSATKTQYLASTLIDNAGGTTAIAAKTAPDFSYPAPKASSYKDNGFSTDEQTEDFDTTVQGEYITYASSYTFDTATGKYSLTNPVTAKYSDAYASLTSKYLAIDNITWEPYTTSSSGLASSNIDYLIKCVEAPYSATASVTFKYNDLVSTRFDSSSYVAIDEASSGMWSMADDYGTSYYYRGAVTNNNVLFGGYCWKVIRINGNGTSRMIYNGTPTDGKCTATGTATQIGTSAFNTNSNDNAYVGYMYGTAGSSTYDATHSNTNSSTVKTVIDTWYNTNLSTYADKISDTEFCNDRSIASAAATWQTDDTALGYGTNITYYGAYNRIYKNNAPILTCPNKHDRFTVDDTTVGNGDLTYPVSLITIDEVAMAGGKVGITNISYYLYTGSFYWTVSAFDFSGTGACGFNVSSDGDLYILNVGDSGSGFRPVINLKAETLFTSGDGTSTNPFVIS
jgi:hypothetical protein